MNSPALDEERLIQLLETLSYLDFFLTTLLEAAQLAAADLDAVDVAVLSDILLVKLEFSCNSECLRAGDALLDPFCLECQCNLV